MSDKSKDTDDQSTKKKSAKAAFAPDKALKGERGLPVMFTEDEMDIYCEKTTLEAYIFHGKELDYSQIKSMTYHHETFDVDVNMKDGSVWDLGVKITWIIRPYFSRAEQVQIVRTKDGNAIDGHFVPLEHVRE